MRTSQLLCGQIPKVGRDSGRLGPVLHVRHVVLDQVLRSEDDVCVEAKLTHERLDSCRPLVDAGVHPLALVEHGEPQGLEAWVPHLARQAGQVQEVHHDAAAWCADVADAAQQLLHCHGGQVVDQALCNNSR